jgi:hypothetical protein
MLKYASLTCVLTLIAVALSAQVTSVIPAVQTTGMVGIGDAQTAQLNLLNPGVAPPATGVVCSAAVSFVDAAGNVLKTTTFSVAPGKSMAFTLRSDIDLHLVAGDRREIRATITIPAIFPPAATAASPAIPSACHVIPTLEILDTISGRTLVVLGHVEAVPSVVAANP